MTTQNFDQAGAVKLYKAGTTNVVTGQTKIQQAARITGIGLLDPETCDQAISDLNNALQDLALKSPALALKLARWFTDNFTVKLNSKAIALYVDGDDCQLTEYHDLTVNFWEARPKAKTSGPAKVSPADLAARSLKQIQACIGKDAKRQGAWTKAQMAQSAQLFEQLERDLAAVRAGTYGKEVVTPETQVTDDLAEKRAERDAA